MAGQLSPQVPSGKSSPITYVRSAFEILANGAPAAAQSLVDLASGAKSEYVRVQAASTILSRVGLGEKVDVGISPSSLLQPESSGAGPTAAQILHERMAALREAALAAAAEEAMTLDGEVVPEVEASNVVQLQFPKMEN